MMDPRDAMDSEQMETLSRAFSDQLLACLEECARGRQRIVLQSMWAANEEEAGLKLRGCASWRSPCRIIFAQQEERNALCDEFLDLCSIHGESHPGERKLARAFLERIERGEVGTPTDEEEESCGRSR